MSWNNSHKVRKSNFLLLFLLYAIINLSNIVARKTLLEKFALEVYSMSENYEFFKLADDCPSIEQQLDDIVANNGGTLPQDFQFKLEGIFQSQDINTILINSGYLPKGQEIRKSLEFKCSSDEMEITVNIHVKL